MPTITARPAQNSLQGTICVSGDKSISHRALILGTFAIGETRIDGLLESADIHATMAACQALGADIERAENSQWLVRGRGANGLTTPAQPLNFGNSGTAARLLMGAMAGNPITAKCIGDASLSARPMGRVIEPLRQMGAEFICDKDNDKLPLTMRGTAQALPLCYTLPVPSAQVKSAILLAALNAPGTSELIERPATRDHTERMLSLFGAELVCKPLEDGQHIILTGEAELQATSISIAGDPSSAAFPLVAALLIDGSHITIKNILVNPYRGGLWQCLEEMGADIKKRNSRTIGGEEVADYQIKASALHGIEVPAERAPCMIDEYPILAMAAARAKGRTILRGLAELRVKESDRVQAIAEGLHNNGVAVEVLPDGLIIEGTGGQVAGGGVVKTYFDHRIAMSFLVLGLVAQNPNTIDDDVMIAQSFPDFFSCMAELGAPFERANA